jgi:hypothetical protein
MNTIELNYRNDLSRKKEVCFVFENKKIFTKIFVNRSICSINKIRSIVLYKFIEVKFIDVVSAKNALLSRRTRISSLSDIRVSNS